MLPGMREILISRHHGPIRQDMNSYLYLLMEDMLFAAAEGLCRKQGDMADIVNEYLVEFNRRELNVKSDAILATVKT